MYYNTLTVAMQDEIIGNPETQELNRAVSS